MFVDLLLLWQTGKQMFFFSHGSTMTNYKSTACCWAPFRRMERPSDNVSAQLSGVAPFKTQKVWCKTYGSMEEQLKNRCCTHSGFGSCGLLHVGATSANEWVCQTRFVCVAHAREYSASAFVSPGQLFSRPLALRSLGRSWWVGPGFYPSCSPCHAVYGALNCAKDMKLRERQVDVQSHTRS